MESDVMDGALQFPSVDSSLRGTSWQNSSDRVSLPSETLLQLIQAQPAGTSSAQIFKQCSTHNRPPYSSSYNQRCYQDSLVVFEFLHGTHRQTHRQTDTDKNSIWFNCQCMAGTLFVHVYRYYEHELCVRHDK